MFTQVLSPGSMAGIYYSPSAGQGVSAGQGAAPANHCDGGSTGYYLELQTIILRPAPRGVIRALAVYRPRASNRRSRHNSLVRLQFGGEPARNTRGSSTLYDGQIFGAGSKSAKLSPPLALRWFSVTAGDSVMDWMAHLWIRIG